ncbi:MAG: SIS domain-containing protein [Oscillospiraceae bacterium]|nr:SIS domain-containing protein [Oscillospiraceae bacterium]MCL2278525.1 SIS domain-containing protein [Oscillospiraceae bacterium]
MALTYKEMQDTFSSLGKTTDYLEGKWGDVESFFEGVSRIVFVGCGSSYSNAKSFAMIWNMHTDASALALAAGDILLHAERYKKLLDGSALVFISRSGKTSELIMVLDSLKELGCKPKVASLVCADDTPLGERSDLVLSTPWAFDESVCQTRCVTNAYFMAVFMAAKLTGNKSILDELSLVISDGSAYMNSAEKLSKVIAKEPWTHAVVLADAELEGIAEEGALVFKEVCQLPSSFHHVLDVRHGPMVLIGKDSLVIVASATGCELENNLLKDLVAKGANVALYSDMPSSKEGVRVSSFGKGLSHITRGIPLIVLCQMIAYYKSKETGADPDKPTGLDPWISL